MKACFSFEHLGNSQATGERHITSYQEQEAFRTELLEALRQAPAFSVLELTVDGEASYFVKTEEAAA